MVDPHPPNPVFGLPVRFGALQSAPSAGGCSRGLSIGERRADIIAYTKCSQSSFRKRTNGVIALSGGVPVFTGIQIVLTIFEIAYKSETRLHRSPRRVLHPQHAREDCVRRGGRSEHGCADAVPSSPYPCDACRHSSHRGSDAVDGPRNVCSGALLEGTHALSSHRVGGAVGKINSRYPE